MNNVKKLPSLWASICKWKVKDSDGELVEEWDVIAERVSYDEAVESVDISKKSLSKYDHKKNLNKYFNKLIEVN